MDLNFKTTSESNESSTPNLKIGEDLNFKTTTTAEVKEQGELTQEGIGQTEAEPNNEKTEEVDNNTSSVPSGDDLGGETPTDRGEEQPSTNVDLSEELVVKFLSEKLGKEVKVEDLNVLTKEPDQEDEYISKLKEWRAKTGRPIEEWNEYTKDYSTLDPEEVLRTHIRREYPNLTNEQIELELDNWMILESDDEDTQTIKELKLAKELPKIREQLQEHALSFGEADPKLITPELDKTFKIAQEIVKSNEQAIAENAKQEELINNTLSTLDAVTIKVGDTALNFKLDDAAKAGALSQINTADRWSNPDGSLNHKLMIEDAAIIANFDKISKMIYEQGLNAGIDQTLKGAANTKVDNPNIDDSTKTSKGPVIHGINDMLGTSTLRFKK